MKFGIGTPGLKKTIKARTTGKAKRAIKKHESAMCAVPNGLTLG